MPTNNSIDGAISQTAANGAFSGYSELPGQGDFFREAPDGMRRRMVAAATRLYPLYSGCGYVANCRATRLLAGKHSGLDWVQLRQGPHLRVMLGDYLSNTVYFTRDWDPKISWACERLLRAGDTALDIGANLGLNTCQMAALVGPSGRVHSFEPNPMVGGLLRQSLRRNNFDHVTFHAVGLGDEDREMELTVPLRNQCLGTLARDEEGTKIRVPVKTLSNVLARENIARVRLMKIDVEGFEERVFRGAEPFFQTVRPDAILFELNHYEGPFENHPTVQFLRRYGYDFLTLPRKLVQMKAKRFTPEMLKGSPSNDLIAAPRGPIFDEVATRLGD